MGEKIRSQPQKYPVYVMDGETLYRNIPHRAGSEGANLSDLDTLMILADEYEELEKEREVFGQEKKLSKTKSASPTDNQGTRGNDQWSPPHQARRQQATDAPRGGQWTPPPQQQKQPNNTLWRLPSNIQRPPISQTRRRPVESSGCYFAGYAARWVSGAPIAADLSRRCHLSKLTGKLIEEKQQLSAAVMIGGNSYKATIDTGATSSFVSEELADNIAAQGRITSNWPRDVTSRIRLPG